MFKTTKSCAVTQDFANIPCILAILDVHLFSHFKRELLYWYIWRSMPKINILAKGACNLLSIKAIVPKPANIITRFVNVRILFVDTRSWTVCFVLFGPLFSFVISTLFHLPTSTSFCYCAQLLYCVNIKIFHLVWETISFSTICLI